MIEFLSKDVREHMERNHLEFTDFEKAALTFHSGLPVLKAQERLEKLAKETADASLREQILAWLASERQNMEAFRSNTEGYVYAVEAEEEDNEPYVCGYFATADLAYAHGRKRGCAFKVEKYRIVGLNGLEAKKLKLYRNPYLMDGRDVKECVEEYDDDYGFPEARAEYSGDGTLEYFYSTEIDRSDEEMLSTAFDPARFENAFIHVPNPFERGDIVRLTADRGERGVVATSQAEWTEFLEKVTSQELKGVDFVDASITVDFLQRDGTFSHEHICPAFLESFAPRESDADYGVLMSTSAVHRGKGTLDFFLLRLHEYQKQLKEK